MQSAVRLHGLYVNVSSVVFNTINGTVTYLLSISNNAAPPNKRQE